MYIYFDAIKNPIHLVQCPELLAFIKKNLSGWSIRVSSKADPHHKPIITIQKTPNGYSRKSNWLDEPKVYKHPVEAVCDFFIDLMYAYLAENQNFLCLHCAAVKFGSELYLFPSTYGAGKSTLAVALAKEGAQIFSEDVLPLDLETGECIASGIRPRLRNPLPEEFSDDFKNFVEVHTSLESRQFRYLDFLEDMLAPFGARGKISRIYVIDRVPDLKEPVEDVIAADQILKRIIQRNFSHAAPATSTLTFFLDMIEKLECRILKYPNTEAAAAYLKQKISTSRSIPNHLAPLLVDPPVKAKPRRDGKNAPVDDLSNSDEVLYQQSSGIFIRAVEESVFLVGPENETLYCLDGLGGPIWNILEEPISISGVALLISEAFPETPIATIKQDTRNLFQDLKSRGLIDCPPEVRKLQSNL